MASRAETLATQFEAKVQEATTLIVADGKTGAGGSMDTIHAMNAKHAQEFAAVTKAETLALHKKNAAATAAIVRGLSDAQLDAKGTLLAAMPPVSAAQLAGGLLCSHIDEHLTSIRATVGR